MLRAICLLSALLLVACRAPAGEPETAEPRRRVEGLISEVRTEGSAVVAFTLDAELEKIEVLIDPARDYGFDLNHLKEHRDLKQPVLVALERRGGGEYAVSIDDA